jgi:transcriptional regulator with XRE-family HTH domain
MIYTARSRAGLSQIALDEVVGKTQSVVARLENADYEGHPLTMLQRIAAALNQRLEIRFLRQPQKPRTLNQKAA